MWNIYDVRATRRCPIYSTLPQRKIVVLPWALIALRNPIKTLIRNSAGTCRWSAEHGVMIDKVTSTTQRVLLNFSLAVQNSQIALKGSTHGFHGHRMYLATIEGIIWPRNHMGNGCKMTTELQWRVCCLSRSPNTHGDQDHICFLPWLSGCRSLQTHSFTIRRSVRAKGWLT